jgi:hypothetical protein
MSIRADRHVNLADISSNPSCLILGSIFTTPDTFDTFVGTGSGVKQLAYANGATNATISSATPASQRVVDAEPVLTASSIAINGSIAAVRGNATIASGKTLASGYLYGVQGKITVNGTLATANYSAGLVGQLDLSAASSITGNLQALWLDAGATSGAASLATTKMLSITNTTTKLVNSLIYAVADASYFLNLSDLAFGGKHFIVTGAVGGSQDKKLKCNIDGTDYFIPLNTV